MTVELRTLRVSAELDASRYVAGSQQMASATSQAAAGNAALGASVTQVQTKISAAGDPIERLNRQFVDGYAAGQRMASAFNALGRAIDTGKVSMQQADKILDGILTKYRMVGDASQFIVRGQNEMAAAIGRANTRFLEQNNRVPANNNARLSSGQIQNLSFQANDILTMALMGASPGQIAVSQGGQIVQALQMGEGGIAGSLNAIKGSAAAAGSALVGTLGVVGSISTGFGLAAAAAGAFYLATREKAKDLKDATEDQRKAVSDLAEAYGDAGLKADDFYRKSIIASESEARRTTEELRKSSNEANQTAIGAFMVNRGGGGSGNQFGPSTVVNPEFSAFSGQIEKLNSQVRAGRPDYAAFEKSISDVVANNPALQTTADKILGIVAAATAAAAQLKNTDGAIHDITRGQVGVNIDRLQQFGRDQIINSQRFGDDPFAAQREQQRQKVLQLAEAERERAAALSDCIEGRQLPNLFGETA